MVELPELARKLMTEGKNFASVATLMPDGSPQVSVVWIDTDGRYILFNTVRGRLKERNLHRDPGVALSITNSQNPYQEVIIRGRVVEMT